MRQHQGPIPLLLLPALPKPMLFDAAVNPGPTFPNPMFPLPRLPLP
ncbi:hypothetical protein I545_5777 [Mycobacterium kansasii 662]|uniref:Uncharacterized protein n=3 Tax=Mycobacterium kansasii TaxID=1768 RepID=A0A1V3WUW1_MYCKA|nr:hypothetical protein MKAN_11090 [Mycobacterium kansasii ATCC 12478]EUA10441.1 hypothetical protein I545_5777 [Mycobacterium kansasii 662]KEP41073.1 hypothetical protein MKSMC1_38100 [Mycobacterium kansasii]OOK70720.1 hypothetical protein BZL30_6590 [Mycobacterium kansasii]